MNSENKRKYGGTFPRMHSRSVFWKYIALYMTLMLTTFVLLAIVLGNSYLHMLNRHRESSTLMQAQQAVSTLEVQMDTMHDLALQLSIHSMYRKSYLEETPYHSLLIADSLTRYASYNILSSSFSLLYQESSDIVKVFTSEGLTTDLAIFLSRCQLEYEADVHTFLFVSNEPGRLLECPEGILVAYPIPISSDEPDATLCFYISTSNIERHIFQVSNIEPENYVLTFHRTVVIETESSEKFVSAGDADSWCITVNVPAVSLSSLLRSASELLAFLMLLLLLVAIVFCMAFYCYQPFLRLFEQFDIPIDHTCGKNEFTQLNDAMSYLKLHSSDLSRTISAQNMQLCEYALLFMLHNSSSVYLEAEIFSDVLEFSYPWFFVLTLMPCSNQAITQENIGVLQKNISDIAQDDELIYVVESDPASHLIAVICNMAQSENAEKIESRLRTCLSLIPHRFFLTCGSVTKIRGVSASYLAAKSALEVLVSAQTNVHAATVPDNADILQIISQLVFEIEISDCGQAMAMLERCIDILNSNPSELIRYYQIMQLLSAIQQLCSQIHYELSPAQLSTLLPSNNLQSIHYALLQLIPVLCSYSYQQNNQAFQPTAELVMNYLETHFSEYDLSAQKIADAVGIGINRVYSIIREETGHSYKTALTQLKIRHAKTYLQDNTLSISDIASKLGYGSASYFIKVFKNATGLPPDAYRKKLASDNSFLFASADENRKDEFENDIDTPEDTV